MNGEIICPHCGKVIPKSELYVHIEVVIRAKLKGNIDGSCIRVRGNKLVLEVPEDELSESWREIENIQDITFTCPFCELDFGWDDIIIKYEGREIEIKSVSVEIQ
ncbi:MAG: hypothetical protein Q6363_009770 [Candidatus Njordarchaeota archaeon]